MISYVANTRWIKLVKADNGFIITYHDKNKREDVTLVFETMQRALDWIDKNMGV